MTILIMIGIMVGVVFAPYLIGLPFGGSDYVDFMDVWILGFQRFIGLLTILFILFLFYVIAYSITECIN